MTKINKILKLLKSYKGVYMALNEEKRKRRDALFLFYVQSFAHFPTFNRRLKIRHTVPDVFGTSGTL